MSIKTDAKDWRVILLTLKEIRERGGKNPVDRFRATVDIAEALRTEGLPAGIA